MVSRKLWGLDPLALVLSAVVVVLAAVIPLVPEPYRAYNFAAFGALGLFASARLHFAAGMLLALGGKLISDLLNYSYAHPGNADYLPIWYVVLSFAVYPLCGRLVKSSRNPAWILGSSLLGSVAFFLITNFASWLRQDLPYSRDLTGLMNSYAMGIEFYRGTLLSDVLLSGGLFAVHALLQRVTVARTAEEC